MYYPLKAQASGGVLEYQSAVAALEFCRTLPKGMLSMSSSPSNLQYLPRRLDPSPVSANLILVPSFKRKLPAKPRDLLDYALFLPCIWLVSALGFYFRLGGPLIVLAVMAICVGYAVLRCSAPPKWVVTFVLVCVAAGILSQYQVFPVSWQVHFRHEAISRQLGPVIVFFVMAWASKAYFERRLRSGDAFAGGGIMVFLGLVIAPIILFQQGFQYEGEDPLTSMFTMYGSFTNNITIAMFFLTAGAFAGSGWRRYISIVIILAMLSVTSLAQFGVVSAGILAILIGAPGRLIALGIIGTLSLLYLVGFFFVHELLIIAPNTGIRLVFLMDTFKSVLDTFGTGIGYGTESVRWRYYFPNRGEFTFLPEPSSMTHGQMLEALSTGVHNSFFQALLRTGVIGFAVLSLALFSIFPRHNLPRKLRNHASINFAIMFICCFVNPALESPIQGLGVGFVYGYLIALRTLTPSRA